MELEGKVAIVTGGTRGIGKAIVNDLAAQGADIALNYRKSVDLAQELAESIQGMGRRSLVVQADVSSFDDALAMVQKVLDEFGQVDILVNNAGMNWDGVVWKMTEEQWDRVISVDLKGTFNYTRAVTPIFREQGSGKIVNITLSTAYGASSVRPIIRQQRRGLSDSPKPAPVNWVATASMSMPSRRA